MTREQLKSFRNKNIEAKKLEQTIEELRSKAEIQASALSHTPKSHENECKILKSIESIEAVTEKLNQKILDFSMEIADVYNCIESLNNDKIRTIFQMRYLDAETFETIAYEMNLSWRHVHRLHAQGLQEIEG